MKPLAGLIRLVVQYFQGAYVELRGVSWPSRQSIVHYTILVTVTIIVSAAILTAIDFGLKELTHRYLIH